MELVKAEQAAEPQQISIPDLLPVLPLPDMVVFPYMIVPLFVNRERSAKAVDQALSENRMILLVSQKTANVDDPKAVDLYEFGTVSIILRMLKLPDGRVRILVQGFSRAQVEYYDESKPYLTAKVQPKTEPQVTPDSVELEALIRNAKSSLEKMVSLGKNISPDLVAIASNLEEPARLSDLIASNLDLKVDKAQEVLELIDPVERLRRVHALMAKEIEVLEIQNDINMQARGEMDKSQREFYLRQQMKAIQQELGEGNEVQEEIDQYRKKIKKAKMPEDVAEETERQLGRLERMHPDAAETATLRNYIDWMVSLPWSKSTKDNLDLNKAQAILDEDHYGLEKIKERIIEHLAVRKLKKNTRGPILCFVGPPGVGKTSLGKSIARALGRKFVRMSLGGVHDEAEIRGHRRTYVGAMPGRIIQNIHQAGTNNPVFMMDEVDKIGSDFRGDPSSALLEVLDPEQNFAFRDNYLGLPFDLSNVMFITTANMLDPIQPAFRDRMEIISLTGYTEEEKLEIAKRHLIRKQTEAHGLKKEHIQFTDEGIRAIINLYTQEAGLRNLEREIASVCRKVARQVAMGEKKIRKIHIDNLDKFLGRPKVFQDELLKRDQIGVATGLAWTPVGGDILFIEATAMKGKGVLTLTGQLGDVMKESAQAALSYARSHAKEFGIDPNFFGKNDIHIHVPEGSIPKDGPSAGVTMATAMLSLLTGKAVHRKIAMTGEITLRGEVLPVGGIKEKVLAARRAKIDTVILPSLNERDLEDVNETIRKEMKFILVDDVKSVFKAALLENKPEKVVRRPRRLRKSAEAVV
ncbi:MAG: endopeptidase La [Acidobacteria bacterium]|nr:MAG: endopeptidase La [Acidobacteriota bacterium]